MSNAIRIIMLGRQGAGKGTQCLRLAAEFGAPHISTGEMLRAAVRKDSPLGRAVKAVLDKGELVNDELMISLVQGRIGEEDARVNGFILDGFPRTVANPWSCEKCGGSVVQRADDTPEAINHRLDLYDAMTSPLVAYYKDQNKLAVVDGLGTPDEVFTRLSTAVAGIKNRSS